MYRCTVLLAALYEAGGLFLVPFQDRDIHGELIGRLCNPLAGWRDIGAGRCMLRDGRSGGGNGDYLFNGRKGQQCVEMLAGEGTHEIVENTSSAQRVGYRMMKRQDDRSAVGCPQSRRPHERPRNRVERQSKFTFDDPTPVGGCLDRSRMDFDRVIGFIERRSGFCIVNDTDPQRGMPPANLIERRAQLGRIKRASDLGDETEMYGKGERIETDEPLAAPEQAHTICGWQSANNITSR